MGEIQNSEGRVKTLPPDAVKDGCGEEGVLGARVGVGGWVGGGAGGGHLMGPLSSGQLRPAAEAALVSVRDLATDQSAPPSQLIFSFNCEPVIQLCIGSWLEPPLRHRNHKAPLCESCHLGNKNQISQFSIHDYHILYQRLES